MNFIFILGATATGKSELALKEAQKRKAEIINCDSVQVFKNMHIGSAQPQKDHYKKVPHHLYDFVDVDQNFTVGDYLREVKSCLKTIKSSTVFFVGGSGFFAQALEKGLWSAPKTTLSQREKMKQRVFSEGLPTLYRELKQKDPLYSQKIHPQDSYRIQRALLIMEIENKTLTKIKNDFKKEKFSLLKGSILKIGLLASKREIYKRKLKKRIEIMLEKGLKEETQNILKHGNFSNTSPLRGVGYREMVDFLEGRFLEKDLVNAILQHSLKLSKKQRTWFKKDPEIHWFDSPNKASYFLDKKLPPNS